MRWLELKVPPPAVALLVGVLMRQAAKLAAPIEAGSGVRLGVAIAIASAGLVFGLPAVVLFVRSKTTIKPTQPDTASSLVTGGIFRFTRNPMYLSLLLYLLAWAVYLSNWLALPFLPLFVWYINEFQIKPEERALSRLFGAAYDSYKTRVRRWL